MYDSPCTDMLMIACEPQECALQNQTDHSEKIANSGLVNSSQSGVHPQLEKYVRRHMQTPWSQPLHPPSVDAYHRLMNEAVLSSGLPFILDSGCGTGISTQNLGKQYPECLVIGVDQSRARLSKSGVVSDFLEIGNCILIRAELATFWRLLLADGFSPLKHFLFYPNPWPKPRHLLRRWHGHPVFPQLLALGGEIELRCNWQIYALEFSQAVTLATGIPVNAEVFEPEIGITPFECKYLERGQQLYSVHC